MCEIPTGTRLFPALLVAVQGGHYLEGPPRETGPMNPLCAGGQRRGEAVGRTQEVLYGFMTDAKLGKRPLFFGEGGRKCVQILGKGMQGTSHKVPAWRAMGTGQWACRCRGHVPLSAFTFAGNERTLKSACTFLHVGTPWPEQEGPGQKTASNVQRVTKDRLAFQPGREMNALHSSERRSRDRAAL